MILKQLLKRNIAIANKCEFLKKIRGSDEDCIIPGIYNLTKKGKTKLFEYYYGKDKEK